MVTAGDPVQDLAWYLLLDRHHVMAFDVPRLPGLPPRHESVARWAAASGHSAEHLEWYELLGAARYAAILTRVMKLLDASGVFPGGAAMAYDQTGSQLLERLLDERA
jgi:aminoglycoside phosphotransferase (APT) family kinase protein